MGPEVRCLFETHFLLRKNGEEGIRSVTRFGWTEVVHHVKDGREGNVYDTVDGL